MLFLVTAGFTLSGYEIYAYTESSEFCGTLCHPMGSQYSRYTVSAHAKVECAQCHIGPGASFFVKSKIDGIRQVYAVLTHTYNRPITSPVSDLRPARETCETCHTPTSFQENVVKTITHYENDEANTPEQVTLILRMGGWKENKGVVKGIHWHVNNPVYYIASDAQRQKIAWVGVEQPDGSLQEYFSRDMLAVAKTTFVEQARQADQVRLLDCIDCHNRAAHFIPHPEAALDDAIQSSLIPADLPYIHAKSMELLSADYPSTQTALTEIDRLREYYQAAYPQVYASRLGDIEAVIGQLKQIYSSTNFPDMNLNWETNPNNERHQPFLGCFRCHDDNHVRLDQYGNELEAISSECNLCHTVPIVGRGGDLQVEAPVIVGALPESHADFSWTIEHRNVPQAEIQDCYTCHGQGFCNNGVCHNLEHPEDMLYRHADIYKATESKNICQTCHQEITCARCHVDGFRATP